MDRADEIVSLLTAMKQNGYVAGNAASVLASLAAEDPTTRGFSDETLILAHLSLFSSDPRHLQPAIELAKTIGRRDLLDNLLEVEAGFREPETPPPLYRPVEVDERFREHCRRNGATILRQLQTRAEGREACRSVFLVIDSDGLVKVFKELRPAWASRLGLIDDEGELYERLGPVRGLPNYYGTTVIDDDLSFLRMGVCYGRRLDDLETPIPREEADFIVGRLAGTLARLHARGVVYNDLRPSNVKIDCDKIHLLDIGDAQVIHDGEVTTYVHGPRHVAPEVVLRHKACPASDVFQLGVVYYELLTGRHPFNCALPIEEDHDLSRLSDCLANVMLSKSQPRAEQAAPSQGRLGSTDEENPDGDASESTQDLGRQWPELDSSGSGRTEVAATPLTHINDLLARMLDADPTRRPAAAEVAERLRGTPPRVRVPTKTPESNGTVLFPARIGIPHRGHVDFIARLMELGYEVLVSLGASYVQTHLDPLPKWTVMKMIGRSLEIRGLDTQRVKFACTPLFEDADQIGLHYALMPGVEKVVAVASGNEEVHRLFHGRWPIIDQAALFAREGEDYEVRSWGSRLREAVTRDDRVTFDELIAPGVEEIMSLSEMQAYCARPPHDFAWGRERGRVLVVLRDATGKELARERVSTYSTPEDTLVQSLRATFVDRFSKNSVVRVGSRNATLTFEDTTLDGLNLSINYRLEDAA